MEEKEEEINPLILSQVNGFTQLSKEQIDTDPTYKRVNDFLIMVNQPLLDQAKVIAAFFKNSGFSRSYKVYYSVPDMPTYEGYVTYDIFRDKLYIINFGTVGYSLS